MTDEVTITGDDLTVTQTPTEPDHPDDPDEDVGVGAPSDTVDADDDPGAGNAEEDDGA